jgi:hypothetical protein
MTTSLHESLEAVLLNRTNILEVLNNVLLSKGYTKSAAELYYYKRVLPKLYQIVCVYPSMIKYKLTTSRVYNTDGIKLSKNSALGEFDEAYSKFEQQCEIYLTTTLFSYDRF